jgi:UDP-N-acetylglucosamine 4,6-dehydratase
MFQNKTILITGGTGSFGNAVLERFLDSKIKEIRIFSRDEKKQHDLRIKLNNSKVKFYIGDVKDPESIESVMNGVDYVFHAAALKQVPSCEFFPMEAVKTNVIGTKNVISSAIKNKVKKIICLSTDKAAYPINTMGISKALMEKIAIAESRNIYNNETIICLTRYGNVMASRGSVIPLFIEKIKSGLPLSITDPKMTRFLMSLDDAVDLVLYAYKHGEQGDLFIQKSPSADLMTIATALKEIFDYNKEFEIIGSRHGEKLHETLCTREEMMKAISLENYFRIAADNRTLNYSKFFSEGDKEISSFTDYNSNNTHKLNLKETKELLMTLDIVKSNLSLK